MGGKECSGALILSDTDDLTASCFHLFALADLPSNYKKPFSIGDKFVDGLAVFNAAALVVDLPDTFHDEITEFSTHFSVACAIATVFPFVSRAQYVAEAVSALADLLVVVHYQHLE
jgi:hypothetical protein